MADEEKPKPPSIGDRLTDSSPNREQTAEDNSKADAKAAYLEKQIAILAESLHQERVLKQKTFEWLNKHNIELEKARKINEENVKLLNSFLKDQDNQIDDLVEKVNITEAKYQAERAKNISEEEEIVEKKLETTLTKIMRFGKQVATLGLSGIGKTINKLTSVMNCGVCDFLNNTLGGIFKFFSGKGNFITSFFTTVVNKVWSGIKWVYDVGKKALMWVWDKFVMLAKIGWKVLATVWEFISTPANIIYDIFSEAFISIISSPVGFIGMAIGFTILLRFAIKNLWPKLKSVFISVFDWAWKGIEKFFANIFTGGDVAKLETNIKKYSKQIEDWFGKAFDWLIKTYDDNIGKAIGMDSATIKSYVMGKWQLFQDLWSKAQDVFLKLYDSDILEEAIFAWNAVKHIVNIIEHTLGQTKKDSTESAYEDALRDENKKRTEAFYSEYINALAQSELQLNLADIYLNNSSMKAESLRALMVTNGEKILDNIQKSTFNSNAELNSEYVSSLDRSILRTVVDNILKNSADETSKMKDSAERNKAVSFAKLSELNKISNSFDPSQIKSGLDSLINKTSDLNVKIYIAVDDFLANKDKDLTKLTSAVSDSTAELYSNMQSSFKTNATNMNLSFEFMAKQVQSDIANLEKNYQTMSSDQIELIKSKYDDLEELKKYVRTILKDRSDEDIERTAKMLHDMYGAGFATVSVKNKAANGMLATGPTEILVGEGNYPEVIVPLSFDGAAFITKSMEDLFKAQTPSPVTKQEAHQSMVTRHRKSQPKQDMKIYDMKNISNGILGIR